MKEITFPNLINAKTGKTLVVEVPDEMYKDHEMHKLQDKLNESKTKVSQEERSKEYQSWLPYVQTTQDEWVR